VTRAAFDIGSGAIRCQVADVDIQQEKIAKVHFMQYAAIDFARDLKASSNERFSQPIMDDAVAKITHFKEIANQFSPKEFRGIATEAFRMSHNGNETARRILDETGVEIKIVSHEEEALYGFYNAMSHSDVEPGRLISWDSGAGSLQLASHDGEELVMFLARLGRIPVQHYIVETLQNRDFTRSPSPNPIQEQHAHQAIDYIKKQLQNIPEALRSKLDHPDSRIMAIGAHSKLIPVNSEYSQDDLRELLFTHCNKSDDELNIEDAPYVISDLILGYSVMSALGIKKAYRLSTKNVGNTSGLLVNAPFWK
jgi:exopolyphosphatase/guanosine-5'-triphosphate,3'-diphosphate pyrophosphatase